MNTEQVEEISRAMDKSFATASESDILVAFERAKKSNKLANRIAALELENQELRKANRELLSRFPSGNRWVDAGE